MTFPQILKFIGQLSIPILLSVNLLPHPSNADLDNNSRLEYNFTEYWWPALRVHVANSLIRDYGLGNVEAFDEVFDNFPENGGCWCQGDRSNATKGVPPEENPYDQICRDFHMCMKCTSFEQVCKDNYGDEFGFVEPENITWIMGVRRIRDTFHYPGFAGRTSVEVENYNYTTEMMQVFDWRCVQNQFIDSCQDYACQCYENLWYQFTAQIEEDYLEGSYKYDKECPNDEMPRVPLFGEKRCCGHCPGWYVYQDHWGAQSCCDEVVYGVAEQQCCEGARLIDISGNCADPWPTYEPPITMPPADLHDFCEDANSTDVLFLIDGSSSLNNVTFALQLEWVRKVSDYLSMANNEPGDTRIAVAQFTTRWKRERNYVSTTTAIEAELDQIEHMGGGTDLNEALSKSWRAMIRRRARADVHAVIVLLTDGRSTKDWTDTVEHIKSGNVTIITAGYGGASYEDMEAIATDRHHAFFGYQLENLENQLNELTQMICQVNETWSDVGPRPVL